MQWYMISRNSRSSWRSQHKPLSCGPAAFKLVSFGALICQVLLTGIKGGFLWEALLCATQRPLHSLAFVLSWMQWSSLMCTLHSGPPRALFPTRRQSPPSVRIYTYACKTHIQTHTQFPMPWSKLSAVIEDDLVRLLPPSCSLRWHYDETWGQTVCGCSISIQVMKSSEPWIHSLALDRNW